MQQHLTPAICRSLPHFIIFLSSCQMGDEEALLRQWLDVSCTESGLLVAHQTLRKRPILVGQMVEEWLNHYRRLA